MEPRVKIRSGTKNDDKFKEPEQFKVILLNDQFTTMEFVVDILVVIFHKSVEDANRIMLNVHEKGRGVVGVFTWDIAATKIDQVHIAAKANEFPLRCIAEPA